MANKLLSFVIQHYWLGQFYHVIYASLHVVPWASDWGWIEETLNSRWSPPDTEVFLSASLHVSCMWHPCI